MADKALHIDVSIQSNIQPLEFSIETSGGGGHFPYYTGSYTVEPRKVQQILPTRNKSMREDLVVNEIYYSEVSNPSGGNTVVIGQE